LIADLTIGRGIDGAEPPPFFSTRVDSFEPIFEPEIPSEGFRAFASFFAPSPARRLAPPTTFFSVDDLPADAFTLANFLFDASFGAPPLFFPADDETPGFFLDLPTFIGGPTRPAPATLQNYPPTPPPSKQNRLRKPTQSPTTAKSLTPSSISVIPSSFMPLNFVIRRHAGVPNFDLPARTFAP